MRWHPSVSYRPTTKLHHYIFPVLCSLKSVGHLLKLPGASERLILFSADLLRPGAFDQAVRGCEVVVHTASPYDVDVKPGQEEEALIRPAVEGTENVLNSVNKTPTVRRVVLTSSTAAVFTDPHERGKDHVFTEADWNITARPNKFPYFYSKVKAEQRAYEMCKLAGGQWTLATINPGAIWGPPLSDRIDGESVGQMRELLSGKLFPWAPTLGSGFVDVRDVAEAHYLAVITPGAQGRHLINAESRLFMIQASKVLRRRYPQLKWKIPRLIAPFPGTLAFGPVNGLPMDLAWAMCGKIPKIDTSKAAQSLNMTKYIVPDQTVLDMAETMLAKGMGGDHHPISLYLALAVTMLLLAVVAVVLGPTLYAARHHS